ncbi:redoxin family protein, partial [Acinetobacter baumannii]
NDTTIADAHFYSGAVAEETWTAVKNDHAKLPDEFGYSHLRSSGISTLSFSFKNTDGKVVSVKDEKYKGKVVVVQILGSWCPNCMDETAFLSA